MATIKIPVAVWRDHAGMFNAEPLEHAHAAATDATSAGAVGQVKQCLDWLARKDEIWTPRTMKLPEVHEFRVPIRTSFQVGPETFPSDSTFALPISCLVSSCSGGGVLCWLPLLGVHFYCPTRRRIARLVAETAQRELHGATPRILARLLPPADMQAVWAHVRTRQRNDRSADADLAATPAVAEPLSGSGVRKRLSQAFGREEEARRLAERLGPGHGSLLLVGESGVGKTTLLAAAIRHGERVFQQQWREQDPDVERRRRFWLTAGARLIAGMQYLGQWEQRCERVIEELSSIRGVLCVENLLDLILAGGGTPGSGLAAFFAPYLQTGELRMIGEATPRQLDACRRLLPGFTAQFQVVPVEPFEPAAALKVLQQLADHARQNQSVEFTPASLHLSQRLFRRFLPYNVFPGKCAQFVRRLAAPESLLARVRASNQTRAERADQTRAERADQTRAERADQTRAEQTRAGNLARSTGTAGAARPPAQRRIDTPQVIAQFIEQTGLPEWLLRDERPLDPDEVFDVFARRICGQPGACQAAARLITQFKAGLNDPQRPLGVLVFCGPTGVGKTETAKALADYLFGAGADRERLVRLDMSEYGGFGAAERLLTSADGGPSALIKRVRSQPFVVVLLDEVEKAADDVYDVLLSLLDEGRLTDRFGRTTNFRSAVIVMTTNLGARTTDSIGFDEDREGNYQQAVARHFRPELYNRFDEVITFAPLAPETICEIARKELAELALREGLRRARAELTWSEEIVQLVAREGFDRRYGARPLQRALERLVVAPLSRWIAEHPEIRGRRLRLAIKEGQVTVDIA